MTVLRLVAPRFLATRNALRRAPVRSAVLAALIAFFWGGVFGLVTHVLGYFQTLGDFGPLLTQRLLALLFLTFFGILLVSNTVTALSTFYLAGDVNVLLAAPVTHRQLHHARFLETLVSSSWMVVLFGLPIFLAYGVVYRAGPAFYVATLGVLGTFVVIPAGLGVLFITGLVLVFPARRTRDALLVASGLLIGGGVLAVRWLAPERLAHADGLAGFTAFLGDFGATGSPYLPTTWAADALVPLLGARPGDPLFPLAMLASTAAMLFVVSATVVERVFLTAWSRAQAGRVQTNAGGRTLGQWLTTLARPLPRLPGLLLVKDASIFLRDASQWSQLLLLGALVGIYVYNFSALPIGDDSALAIAMQQIAAVSNLGLGAFVATAVAVRFVYPMVSLEGRVWWLLRTAPVSLERLWWSKFWIGFAPLLVFAELLIALTYHMLGAPPGLTALLLLTLVPLVAAVVSLGLAFGAVYPRFDTENAAQIATGFGAIVYMVTCLGLIAVVVACAAWPVAQLFWCARWHIPLGRGEAALVALGLAAAATIAATAFVVARRVGVRALARLAV